LNATIHTAGDLETIVASLSRIDTSLASVVACYGMPPLWPREPGFATLLHIILEQQVSLASARTAFERLVAAIGTPTPRKFLTLDDVQLKVIGFSGQKARYGRELARALVKRRLDLKQLALEDDDTIRAELTKIPGIGHWTVDIYLLLALRRSDAFAATDLALQVAAQRIKNLHARPSPAELHVIAERWRPYRAAAARLLWHAYLSERAAKRPAVN
jgi:DNA-3-methyladenine glycosylase II